MSTDLSHGRTAAWPALRGLVGAAHIGPALAVTVLSGLLAAAQGLGPGRGSVVVAAVLAGQLSVGWSNDLLDLDRDRRAGRTDKPIANGEVAASVVRACCAVAVVACVVLSLACGAVAGAVHLGCVAAAWAYNLGLKSTPWSWVPYAAAFGGLTAFVSLADGHAPPWWWPVGAALLGVGAHLLNVLPDLEDDAATGVHGLPHALGRRRIAPVAAAVLVAATAVVLLGADPTAVVAVVSSVVVLALAVVVVTDAGRRPFAAAIGIALVDAVLLVVAR